MLLPSRRSLIGQKGISLYQTKDGHQTQDGWILGLAGRISHLTRLRTVCTRLRTVLPDTSGEQDVKDTDAGGKGEPRGLVLLAPRKENFIENPLNVST